MSNLGEANKIVRILLCVECGAEMKANSTLKRTCFHCKNKGQFQKYKTNCKQCNKEIEGNCKTKSICFKCKQSNKRQTALLAKHKKNGNTIS